MKFVPALSASDSETTEDAVSFSKAPIKSSGEMQPCECNRVNKDFQACARKSVIVVFCIYADPCSLTVQVKQILQICRLFSGTYCYERHSLAAGNLSKRSGGTMNTPSRSTVQVYVGNMMCSEEMGLQRMRLKFQMVFEPLWGSCHQ